MTKPLSFVERSDQFNVIADDDTFVKLSEPGVAGTGGVNEYIWLLAGLVAIEFVAVKELTVGDVPELFNDLKLPEPPAVAVIPIDAEGETSVPVSRLVL